MADKPVFDMSLGFSTLLKEVGTNVYAEHFQANVSAEATDKLIWDGDLGVFHLYKANGDGSYSKAIYIENLNSSDTEEKKMVIDITQSGSSAPTGVIKFNKIVGTPTLARTATKTYTITLTGKFTVGKTDCIPLDWTDIESVELTDVNTITIKTNADGVLTSRRFHIIVYP